VELDESYFGDVHKMRRGTEEQVVNQHRYSVEKVLLLLKRWRGIAAVSNTMLSYLGKIL
jgi:hypothetical protein